MKIYFASDHAGFELKEKLVPFVESLGYTAEDLGAHTFAAEDDYPDIIARAAERVSVNPQGSRAIILGGSGQGEAMVANRFPNVRAVVVYSFDEEIVRLSREHNDANVLSLGARFLDEGAAQEIVRSWLHTSFSDEERHIRRINAIERHP